MNEALQVAAAIAATAAAGTAILASGRRLRAAALLGALALALGLILGEGWGQLESLRERPAAFGAAIAASAAAVVALALVLRRRPLALPLLLVAALPFRVPIDVSGEEANLLVPLYVVIGAGAVAYAIDALREGGERRGSVPAPLALALVAATVLYAAQSAYSDDVGFAARNVGFFLVPFAAMFALLSELRWTPRMLALCLAVVAAEAVLFALVAVGQHLSGEIFWNPALERSNDFHFYFRVNSLFWDPNIYGRYMALAAVLVVAIVLWTRDSRRLAALAAVLAILLAGLVLGFSQSSFIALLFGVTVLFGLGVSWRWTAIAAPLAAVAVIAAVFVVGGTSEAEDDAGEISSGRTTLIEGGVELARSEPLIGHGSASFSEAFAEQEGITKNKTTVSHNEPVTVAAEQGAVGLIAYAALVGVALWTLLAGMRRLAPGLGGPADAIGDPAEGGPGSMLLARIALAGAFVGLLVHTIAYGAFLTDPLTWALLAIGGALAADAASSASHPATGHGRPEAAVARGKTRIR